MELCGSKAVHVVWGNYQTISRRQVEQAGDGDRRVDQSKPRGNQRDSTVYWRKEDKQSQGSYDVADKVDQITENCGKEGLRFDPIFATVCSMCPGIIKLGLMKNSMKKTGVVST